MFSLFTVIPVNVTGEDVDDLSRHFWIAPIVGLFYGLVAGGLFYLMTLAFDGLVSAVVVILVVHAVNRFLHFDGLIDLGDGLIATGDHEKKLAAMKDTRVGAGGVGFGVIFTILTIASLAPVADPPFGSGAFFLPLAMEVLAKNTLVTVAAMGESREGLGSPFVRNTPKMASLLSSGLSFIILTAVLLLLPGTELVPVHAALLVLSLVLTSLLVGVLVAGQAKLSFGCVNGDVMGASNELAKPMVILVGISGVVLYLL